MNTARTQEQSTDQNTSGSYGDKHLLTAQKLTCDTDRALNTGITFSAEELWWRADEAGAHIVINSF